MSDTDTNVGKVSYDPWQGMYGSPPGEFMSLPDPYYGYVPVAPAVNVGAWQEIVGAGTSAAVVREGLLAEVAPVLAPGTGGMTVAVDFDAKQQLHASICVDGKCYQGTVDLSQPIAAVMQKIAAQHKPLHAKDASSTKVSGEDSALHAEVIGEVEKLVQMEGATLVGALFGEHMDTAVSGWWSDLKGAASKAVRTVKKGVRRGVGSIENTLVRLKGPIATAAAAAAGAGALSIPGVGPVLAPMASSVAKSLVDASAGTGGVKAAAEAALAVVKEKALKDENLKKVLDVAEKSVAQSTAAYQIAETVKAAAGGDADALKQVKKLAEAEAGGDKAAKAAMDMAREISEALKKFDVDPESVKAASDATAGEDAVGALPWWTIPALWGSLAAHGMTGQAPWASELAGRGQYGNRVGAWQEIVGADRSDRVIATGKPNAVQVLDQDMNMTWRFVMWHPTREQIDQFGGQRPVLFTEEGGGRFLFDAPVGTPSITLKTGPEMGPYGGRRVRPYIPSWPVRYVDMSNQMTDDIALQQAQAHQYARPLTGQPVDERQLVDETNRRFWAKTGYKPGQKLDPKRARDRSLMKVWRNLHAQVKVEAQQATQVSGEDVVGNLPLAIGLVAAALAGYAWWKDHESKQIVDAAVTTAVEADQTPDPVAKEALTQKAVAIAQTAKAKAPRVTRPIDRKKLAAQIASMKAVQAEEARRLQEEVRRLQEESAVFTRHQQQAAAEQILANRIRAAQAAGLSPEQVTKMIQAEAKAKADQQARDAAYREAFAGPQPQPQKITLDPIDMSQPKNIWL